MIKNNFELLFVGVEKYTCLVVEVLYRNQRLCQISKDEGNDKMKIHFLTDLYIQKEATRMEFPLSEFERVIKIAKDQLSLR
jgi:hypothetical protein